jgi:hypothetical protein
MFFRHKRSGRTEYLQIVAIIGVGPLLQAIRA